MTVIESPQDKGGDNRTLTGRSVRVGSMRGTVSRSSDVRLQS